MKQALFSQQDLRPFLFESSLKELKGGLSSLPLQQLTSCVSFLQTNEHSDTLNRLIAIIEATDDTMRLEAIGKGMGLQQFLEVLNGFSHHLIPIEKLGPLLVGLTPLIFTESLQRMDKEQLNLLIQESLSEPLQHQLTVFVHSCEKRLIDYETLISDFKEKIKNLDRETLTSRILETIESRIHELGELVQTELKTIDKALVIIWTTNRLDLISNLNYLKNQFNHQYYDRIGHEKLLEEAPTGLYGKLYAYLESIFLDQKSSNKLNLSLHNDEDAIEGLALFSIWYLKDYWEVGLLPEIINETDLELDPAAYSEKERIFHRQNLLKKVSDHLAKLDLRTIADLKKHRLYSKPMLVEYIRKNL